MQNPSILKPIRIPTGAAILLAVMYFAASFIVPVLQAYFLATLLAPIYNGLKQRVTTSDPDPKAKLVLAEENRSE